MDDAQVNAIRLYDLRQLPAERLRWLWSITTRKSDSDTDALHRSFTGSIAFSCSDSVIKPPHRVCRKNPARASCELLCPHWLHVSTTPLRDAISFTHWTPHTFDRTDYLAVFPFRICGDLLLADDPVVYRPVW